MSQHFHGLSAQGQSDAGGTVLDSSVVPGISPFKDTRQIFRTDSHAGIFHDQRFFFFRIQINGNFSFPAWNDPEIGIEWPEVKGEYKGSASAEGYTLADGTPLNLSDKDQKWLGLKDTFKF